MWNIFFFQFLKFLPLFDLRKVKLEVKLLQKVNFRIYSKFFSRKNDFFFLLCSIIVTNLERFGMCLKFFTLHSQNHADYIICISYGFFFRFLIFPCKKLSILDKESFKSSFFNFVWFFFFKQYNTFQRQIIFRRSLTGVLEEIN